MIKRIRLATRGPRVDQASFPGAWRRAAEAFHAAPENIGPVRMVVCPVVREETPDPLYDGVGIEWFADREHLARFETWLGNDPGLSAATDLDAVLESDRSPVVVVEEAVMRGADWLERRWALGGTRIKQMAIARRAAGLTPAEFSERWRSRAGTIGSAGAPALVIPDAVRGCAYVQNHPVPGPPGGWAYDAVNEVYFEDVESLHSRVEWFAENLKDHAESDLVSESWFVAAREDVVEKDHALSE